MSDRNRIVTLDEFILKQQKEYTSSTGELTNLLRDIGVAAKIINREVNKAGLVNILGVAGTENESGDLVQKLDLYANDKLTECLGNSGECAAVASEELENYIVLPPVAKKKPKYIVLFDPLDG
ncbi:MAG TPA: hypothetical protein VJ508_02610, partial [Saprospiraceae bacterium]|nr:hypothetical protein [Saprospiraceae bacterium]